MSGTKVVKSAFVSAYITDKGNIKNVNVILYSLNFKISHHINHKNKKNKLIISCADIGHICDQNIRFLRFLRRMKRESLLQKKKFK